MTLQARIYMTSGHIEAKNNGQVWAVKSAVYRMIADRYPWCDGICFLAEEHPSIKFGLAKGTIRADLEPWFRVVVEIEIDGEVDPAMQGDGSKINYDIRQCIIDAADEVIA